MPSNTKSVISYFASRLGAIVIFALVGLYLGGAAGTLVVNNAPAQAADLTQPLLCPASTTGKIDTHYGDWYTSPNGGHVRDETKIIRCFDTQGLERPVNAPLTFYGIWYGFWMTAGAVLAGLAGGAWLDWSNMPKM